MKGGMRMPPNKPLETSVTIEEAASMKGGMRMPPNVADEVVAKVGQDASMKGGMRMPPNRRADAVQRQLAVASMKGGMRMPPNRSLRIAALTRQFLRGYERWRRGVANEYRLSRIWCPKAQARGACERFLGR